MKCIRCETDNNLQDRTENQGRCKNCQHPFAFEPSSMGKITFTDPFFLKAITLLSDNNVLFFTPKQFLYLLDKRLKPKNIVRDHIIGWISLLVVIFFILLVGSNELGIGINWDYVTLFLLESAFIFLVASYSVLLDSMEKPITTKGYRVLVKTSIFFSSISIVAAIILLIKKNNSSRFLCV